MNDLRLLELSLQNFKGVERFKLEADGKGVIVRGDNATGKTTLLDAWLWLLFGKDSSNAAEFEIKPLGPDGEPMHGAEHTVEALIVVDGVQMRLRKTYHEVMTKSRGESTATFSGNTTDHYIDGVPLKKMEYQGRIAALLDESAFRLLSDPTYFNIVLPWQSRREMLLDMIGDVSTEDVVAADAKLKRLPEILENRSVADHKKMVEAKRREVQAELKVLPARIDENERAKPEQPSADRHETEAALASLRNHRSDLQTRLAEIKAGGGHEALYERIRELSAGIHKAIEAASSKARIRVDAERDARDAIANKLREKERAEKEMRERLARAKQDIVRREQRMDALREEFAKLVAAPGSPDIDTHCPACGQPYPAGDLEDRRRDAIAKHNEHLARERDRINSEGRKLKEENDKDESLIADLNEGISEAYADAEKLREQLREADGALAALEAQAPDSASDPDVQRMESERAELQQRVTALGEDATAEIEATKEKLRDTDQGIAENERILGAYEERDRRDQRIAEIKEQERTLAAEYERLESELLLTERFIRSKVGLLEERINERFGIVRWQLFEVQQNGGVNEKCEATVNGVPFAALNHGSKLNAGLDVLNAFSRHLDARVPVWIDNAESVTVIEDTEGQRILLQVEESAAKLDVEVLAA